MASSVTTDSISRSMEVIVRTAGSGGLRRRVRVGLSATTRALPRRTAVAIAVAGIAAAAESSLLWGSPLPRGNLLPRATHTHEPRVTTHLPQLNRASNIVI